MKRIVCYGDSNTYGLNPETGQRYPQQKRWTGILQNILKNEGIVMEEGLNGRTTVLDEPGLEYRNGYSYLEACLRSHIPVDYLVLMLGTNDTKTIFGKEAKEIGRHVRKLLERSVQVLDEANLCEYKILLVVPAEISEAVTDGPLSHEFDADSVRKSRELAEVYQQEAKLAKIELLDLSKLIRPSDIDGIHLDPDGHETIAKKIADWIRS